MVKSISISSSLGAHFLFIVAVDKSVLGVITADTSLNVAINSFSIYVEYTDNINNKKQIIREWSKNQRHRTTELRLM